MESLNLPLTPGSTTAILHPFNVLHVSHAVLQHVLSAFNPDTAVVRRTHHRSRSHAGATESRRGDGNGDTASVASSRHSRRSSRDVTGERSGERSHGRHHSSRSDTAEKSRSQRNRRRSSVESDTSGGDAARGVQTASSSRRTRSAEEPLVVLRYSSTDDGSSSVAGATEGQVRRSHSDGARSRTRGVPGSRNALDSNSTHVDARIASLTPRPLSRAAASGLTPPLAPPPPLTDIGKPPLSSRRPSSLHTGASTPDLATRSRHRHHRSGSGGGLSNSSRRSSRSRQSDTDDAGSSVVIVPDGDAARLASTVSAWSPTSWWRRMRSRNMTRPAYLIDHIIHAVPVAIVHYCCELKRQLVTLPLLRFSDLQPSPGTGDTWLPTEERFETLPAPHLAHFLFMRWMLAATESYIEKLFLDESLVVRQLRSKRARRRLLGWGMRLASHTIFDSLLLSIVVPILLSGEANPKDRDASSLLTLQPPRALFTVPGVARGLAMSAAGVTVQRLLMPLASQLVDRAVLTVFEAIEYLIMRRYAQWSDDDDDDDDDDDYCDDDDHDRASLASGVSEGGHSQQSVSKSFVSTTPSGGGTGGAAAHSAEKRVQREQHRLRRDRRDRRKRREKRRTERENAMRLAILRAIVYRVVASLAAQLLIDHPLSVWVELLRGRATLHFTGLLQPYACMTTANDGLSWANLWRYASQLANPTVMDKGTTNRELTAEEGVPLLVRALRRAGRAATQEVVLLSSSVLAASGQTEAIAAVQQRAAQIVARGGIPSAADSVEFMTRTLLSFSPFYYGIQFTVIDKVLSFYMAVWSRLTKQ